MAEYRTAAKTRKDPQYIFLTEKYGDPKLLAAKITGSLPAAREKYAPYFNCESTKAAVLFGANAGNAVTLAALGAKVTAFVSSETEKKYTAAAARAAGVKISCKVCDGRGLGLEEYDGKFGALIFQLAETERFYDIAELVKLCHRLLATGGVLLFGSFDRPAENPLYAGSRSDRKHSLTDVVYAVNTGGFRIKSFTENSGELIIFAEKND